MRWKVSPVWRPQATGGLLLVGGWEIPPLDATPKEQSDRIQAEFTPVGDES